MFVLSSMMLVIATGFWEKGPELTPSNPILVVMALGSLWTTYSGILFLVACGVLFGILSLRIHAGSRVSSIVILAYLVVVRYSTADIMRNNVVDA
ncbi:MAG TPA: hypothetical protein VK210_16060 [Terriglobia bacterium]|nr:hypothetical protein [Terriglobia bacterium]